MKKLLLIFLLWPSLLNAAWNLKGGSLNTTSGGSADLYGWGWRPAITTDASNNVYVAWAQHAGPATWVNARIYVKKWNGSSWAQLGTYLGHGSCDHCMTYQPSIAVLDSTVYVAWSEGYGGYWLNNNNQASVFASSYSGGTWTQMNGNYSATNGSLNDSNCSGNCSTTGSSGRSAILGVVNNTLYVAFYHNVAGRAEIFYRSGNSWIAAGTITGVTPVKFGDVSGTPYLLTTSGLFWYNGSSWAEVAGGAGAGAGSDMTISGTTPYVTYAGRSSQTGPYQVHVKHWAASTWTADGGVLNSDSGIDARSPALTNASGTVYLAWSEGAAGNKPLLYTRSLTSGAWSSAAIAGTTTGHVNTSGAAQRPALAYTTALQMAWDEHDLSSHTRQLYVAGNGDTGAANNDTLALYGANGSRVYISDNTWTNMSPGGVINSGTVGAEAFTQFSYSAATRKAYTYGNYHTQSYSSGEENNALLEFDFFNNRYDLTEISEGPSSENLHGVGHNYSNPTDPMPTSGTHTNAATVTSLGALGVSGSQGGGSGYVYDLLAGIGKPTGANPGQIFGEQVSLGDTHAAYDPDDNTILMLGPYNGTYATDARYYDFATNAWSNVANGEGFQGASVVYDSTNKVFVVLNTASGEIWRHLWTWSAKAGWTSKSMTGGPTAGWSHAAFDSRHGLVMFLMTTGEVWFYNVATSTWSHPGGSTDFPPAYKFDGCNSTDNVACSGAYLTYNSDMDLFMLQQRTDLSYVFAFKYVPSGQLGLVPRKWIARPAPSPFYIMKHFQPGFNTDNGRVYGTGGDHGDGNFVDKNNTQGTGSYRQETYSWDVATHISGNGGDSGFTLEHAYCGVLDGSGNRIDSRVQPEHPDFVSFTYDSARKVFWQTTGLYEHTTGCVNQRDIVSWESGVSYPAGVLAWYVDRYYIGLQGGNSNHQPDISPTWWQDATGTNWEDGNTYFGFYGAGTYSFDVDSGSGGYRTFTYQGPGYLSATGHQDAAYDPTTDQLISFCDSSGYGGECSNPPHVITMDAANPGNGWTLHAGSGYMARSRNPIDVAGRKVYGMDFSNGYLRWYNIDDGDFGSVASPCTVALSEAQIAWDPVNHLLYYFDLNCSPWYFGAYHPTEYGGDWAGQWEPLSFDVANYTHVYPGRNTIGIDQTLGILFMMGKQTTDDGGDDFPVGTMYYYQYASISGGDTESPVVAITSPADDPHDNGGVSTITLSGTCTDNVGCTSIAISGNGNATCTGCPGTSVTWTKSGINLNSGSNNFTITAYDAANNSDSEPQEVIYTPPGGAPNFKVGGKFNVGGKFK